MELYPIMFVEYYFVLLFFGYFLLFKINSRRRNNSRSRIEGFIVENQKIPYYFLAFIKDSILMTQITAKEVLIAILNKACVYG